MRRRSARAILRVQGSETNGLPLLQARWQ